MNILIKKIKGLVNAYDKPVSRKGGDDLAELKCIDDAYLLIEDGKVKDYGQMKDCPVYSGFQFNAEGRFVLPTFVDSHTHLVFGESREQEFVMRIQGKGYEEIAAEGGGILNSAGRLRETSEEDLYRSAKKRLDEVIRKGTGAIEIKSGYGLSKESELKMLRVIKRLKAISPIPIKATFLGAHAIPAEYKENRDAYVDLIINEMLPVINEERLADYIDVFCDRGFFTRQETAKILEAGRKYGLKPKIHANELDFTGGIQVGVEYDAVSVDHLECTGDEEIEVLKNSNTIPTVLPATAFFLGIDYPPARKMIDAGLPVSLASDYNPGSCPSGNMSFIMTLACTKLKMLPEEAFNAVTINAAHALEMGDQYGALIKGESANFMITEEIPSLAFIPYSFGRQFIEEVYLNGQKYEGLENR